MNSLLQTFIKFLPASFLIKSENKVVLDRPHRHQIQDEQQCVTGNVVYWDFAHMISIKIKELDEIKLTKYTDNWDWDAYFKK